MLLDAKVREFNSRLAETENTLLGQIHHLHTDIKDISVLLNECKNANRDEAITLGLGGSPVLGQSITDIHDGVAEKKRRQAVAKLLGIFLEQLVQEVLSPVPWEHFKTLCASIGLTMRHTIGTNKEISHRMAQQRLDIIVNLELICRLGSGPATESQVMQP